MNIPHVTADQPPRACATPFSRFVIVDTSIGRMWSEGSIIVPVTSHIISAILRKLKVTQPGEYCFLKRPSGIVLAKDDLPAGVPAELEKILALVGADTPVLQLTEHREPVERRHPGGQYPDVERTLVGDGFTIRMAESLICLATNHRPATHFYVGRSPVDPVGVLDRWGRLVGAIYPLAPKGQAA